MRRAVRLSSTSAGCLAITPSASPPMAAISSQQVPAMTASPLKCRTVAMWRSSSLAACHTSCSAISGSSNRTTGTQASNTSRSTGTWPVARRSTTATMRCSTAAATMATKATALTWVQEVGSNRSITSMQWRQGGFPASERHRAWAVGYRAWAASQTVKPPLSKKCCTAACQPMPTMTAHAGKRRPGRGRTRQAIHKRADDCSYPAMRAIAPCSICGVQGLGSTSKPIWWMWSSCSA